MRYEYPDIVEFQRVQDPHEQYGVVTEFQKREGREYYKILMLDGNEYLVPAKCVKRKR